MTGCDLNDPVSGLIEYLETNKNKNAVEDKEVEFIERQLRQIDKNMTFDIGKFVQWQSQVTNIKPEYRTMGPEFEFAKLDVGSMPLHVELGMSPNKINGLKTVVETDAGNVVEIACPPFVIATSCQDWHLAINRSLIITDTFEKELKGAAEKGAKRGATLGYLMGYLGDLFNTKFITTKTYDQYKGAKLIPFTKGLAAMMKGTDYSKEDITNAQININMTDEELAMALIKGITGKSSHQYLKNVVNSYLYKLFVPFKKEMTVEKYKQRVAIISYFMAQIPLMTLQCIMNAARSKVKKALKQDAHAHREAFRESHIENKMLLIRLSTIKDFLGFWIKTGLNDMMMGDPVIKSMVAALSGKKGTQRIENVLLGRTVNMWKNHKKGFDEYLKSIKLSIKEEAYEMVMGKIIENLMTMAQQEEIKQPKWINIPNFQKGGSKQLINYAEGAPFMARPDTYIPLKGTGFLVEIRGLNKKIATNEYMKPFQMPEYRKRHKEVILNQ